MYLLPSSLNWITSEYRNKCKESLEVANDYISQISTKISEIDESIKTIKHNEGYSIEKSNEIKTILDASNENLETLNEKKLELQKSIEFLELAFENHPNLEDEIETLNSRIALFGNGNKIVFRAQGNVSMGYETPLSL